MGHSTCTVSALIALRFTFRSIRSAAARVTLGKRDSPGKGLSQSEDSISLPKPAFLGIIIIF